MSHFIAKYTGIEKAGEKYYYTHAALDLYSWDLQV